MRYLMIICAFVLFGMPTFAQEPCAQHILERELRANDSSLDAAFNEFDAEFASMSTAKGSRAELIVIPVVFHVLHQNGEENISEAQIKDAIRIINEDFRARNPEIATVVSEFTDIIGVADIEFRLARVDPNGNATNGIDRIQTNETFVGDDGSKFNPWPRANYLNIWTADVIGVSNAAAYAYRPPAVAGSPSIDGIMCNHRYVGSIGTGSEGGSSHTLSHEIGHYLGLPHPWGPTNEPELTSNCGLDDGISDTPNTIGTSGSCPLTQVTCGSLDNVQNLMDYATCEAMFTQGQVNVMRNVLNSSTAQRNQLGQQNNLEGTGVADLYDADFNSAAQAICHGDEVQLFDASQYDAETWSWVIDGPESLTGTTQDITADLIPGVYDVALTVTQDGVTRAIEKPAFLVVAANFGEAIPFSEDFESFEVENRLWAIGTTENDEHGWELYNGNGTLGDASFRMNNFGNGPNVVDELILGGVDARMVTSLDISFKVAYSQVSTESSDELVVWISNDCGTTWRSVWSGSGDDLSGSTPNIQSTFTPGSSDWETFSVTNIPEIWIGESTFVKWTFTSGGGNHLYLDDINITGDFRDVPLLVFPSNEAVNMLSNTVLDWRAVPGAGSYDYELDVTPDFNSSELQSGTMNALGNSSSDMDTEFETTDLTEQQQYFWRVRADGGDWSEVWSFTVAIDGLGIETTSLADGMVIYPNPSNDLLQVRLTSGAINATAEVLDLAGRKVFAPMSSTSSDIITVQTAELPAGWYVIKVSKDGETAFRQFAVSH